MKKIINLNLLLLIILITGCTVLSTNNNKTSSNEYHANDSNTVTNNNPDTNDIQLYTGSFSMPSKNELNLIPDYPVTKLTRSTLPAVADNSQTKYFRPIFHQIGSDCGQSAGICYQYTYEINCLRDTDASLIENRYPSSWTYNFVNDGSLDNGSWMYWGWNILSESGVPNSNVYGQDIGYEDFRWPSDYEVYYSAMNNRTIDYYKIYIINVDSLITAKEYLYNHNGNSNYGGVFSFSAYIDDAEYDTISNGSTILTGFGTSTGHTMTVVGYDDNIMYDYNNDGLYTNDIDINDDNNVDIQDYEIGAFIAANSWGTGYGNNGFIYIPYKVFASSYSDGGIWSNAVYIVNVEQSHTITHTLKIDMNYDRRDDLVITTGVTADLTKNTPDFEQEYSIFSFDYDSGKIPLNGLNNNPVEIGLDLSDLLQNIDTTNNFRVFLNINRYDTTGSGEIQSVTLIDYTDNENEYYSDDTDISLSGSQQIYSIIIDKSDGTVSPTPTPSPTPGSDGSSSDNPIIILDKNTDNDIDLTEGFVWVQFNEIPSGWGINNNETQFNVSIEGLNSIPSEGPTGLSWWYTVTNCSNTQLIKISKMQDSGDVIKVRYW